MLGQLVYLKDVVTLRLDIEKCTGCGTCIEVCPQAVLAKENGKVWIAARDSCMECGACARNCPARAIAVNVGVGCAAAVINAALGRNSSSACCCIIEQPSSTAGKGEASPDRHGSGCC